MYRQNNQGFESFLGMHILFSAKSTFRFCTKKWTENCVYKESLDHIIKTFAKFQNPDLLNYLKYFFEWNFGIIIVHRISNFQNSNWDYREISDGNDTFHPPPVIFEPMDDTTVPPVIFEPIEEDRGKHKHLKKWSP